MTQLKRENTRLQHCNRVIEMQTLVLLQVRGDVEVFTKHTTLLFEVGAVPLST